MLYSQKGFDAVETHNGLNLESENRKAIRAANDKNLPAIADSDCHTSEQVGKTFTEFDAPIRTMADLVREIKSGACRGRLFPPG